LRTDTIKTEIGEEILRRKPDAQPEFDSLNNISKLQDLDREAKHSIGSTHLITEREAAKKHLEKKLPEIHQKLNENIIKRDANAENINELNNKDQAWHNPKIKKITLPNGSQISASKYADIIINIEAKKRYPNDPKKQANYKIEREITLEQNFKGDVLKTYPLKKYGKQVQKQLQKEEELSKQNLPKKSFTDKVKEKVDNVNRHVDNMIRKLSGRPIINITLTTADKIEPIKHRVQNKKPSSPGGNRLKQSGNWLG